MGIFRAAGWLLGVPSAEDRETRRNFNQQCSKIWNKKVDYINNMLESIFPDEMLGGGASLLDSFPKEFV
ncbi:hypothetical protein [Spiroplasma turonicum]|nr:hypothetical protein [Spiroplasma turonicum]ALX70916.1 hypothetical protein STURO_v1c06570 [Spiroplasma turonicum]